MLQKLNERIQGVIAWFIVILVTITFTIFGIDYYLQNRHGASSAEVKVNNQIITKRDYEINLRRISQMHDREGINDGNDQGLKQQVLDDMILNLISVQSANKNGFSVSPEQANIAILNIPQFQENGQFSNNRYSQALHNAMYTHESFQDEVKKGMLINQQRFAFIGTEFALPDEMNKFVKLFMQSRDYKYITIPATSFYKQVKVNESEVSEYYNKHSDEYYYPEQIAIEYVQLSSKELRDSTSVAEEKVEQYYTENRSSFMLPAKWRLASIVIQEDEKAQGKAKAEELAKFLQAKPDKFEEMLRSTSKTTVDESIVELTAEDQRFDDSILNLTAEKPISAPIKGDSGYVIYKLVQSTPATPRAYADVKDAIHEQLLVDAVQTGYSESLEKLADLSYQTPDSLDMVSKTLNLKVKQSDIFDKTGGSSDLTKNPKVLKAAFSQDVLELGNNSEPLQIDNDKVIVLRVSKHIPANKMPFSAVKEEIKQLITEKRARKLAQTMGKKLLIAARNGMDFTKPVTSGTQQVNWEDIQDAHRDTNRVDLIINDIAFSIKSPGDVAGKVVSGGNYVIVSLSKINSGESKGLDKEQITSINQQIESGYGLMDYNLYINGLMNKAKVVRK